MGNEIKKIMADSVVEVTACFFKKGDKARAREIEEFDGLGVSWEDASREIPLGDRGEISEATEQWIAHGGQDERFDSEFIQDWVGFAFQVVGWDHDSGTEGILQNIGIEETFGAFREELEAIAKQLRGKTKRGEDDSMVRFLTAWSFWSEGSVSIFEDDYEDGVELMGWIDPSKLYLAIGDPSEEKREKRIPEFKFERLEDSGAERSEL
jgi:hypothetical protein